MLKDEVLYALERQKGNVVAGGKLAGLLGVSRTAVWKAVHALSDEGAEIVSAANSGYKLLETSDMLCDKTIRDGLETEFIGRNMTLLPAVDSTNRYLKETDASRLPDGFTVIADGQSGGRGRRGREFLSPKGQGVYLSVLLKPDGIQDSARLLTICAAVAAAKAIENVCGAAAGIKWVNDIYCGGKKICGILTEAVMSGESLEISSVIIGIGINTGVVPEEISGIATSVSEVSGARGIRNRLAASLLNELETVYLGYAGGGSDIIETYEDRLLFKDREVFVAGVDGGFPATVCGIDKTGALVVRDSGGAVRHIVTGEIKTNTDK